MKGNTLTEFLDDLYSTGGPEKEFIYGDKSYIIQAENKNSDKKSCLRLDIYKCENKEAGDYLQTYLFEGINLPECVKQFEQAKIFDGKTIYEAEKDIEVLFG